MRLMEHLERASQRIPGSVGGRRVGPELLSMIRRFVDVRVTGLAAEMTYYVLLSAVPLLTAIAASLGALERVTNTETVEQIHTAILSGLSQLLGEDTAAVEFADEVLRGNRGGLALTSAAIALWLGSRMFRAAIRALDDAYDVPERRTLLQQWTMALGFAVTFTAVLVLTVTLVVVVPRVGGGLTVAEHFGGGEMFAAVWNVARWPVVAAVLLAFITWLYRVGPNVNNTVKRCLPGAVFATAAVAIVSALFGVYLQIAGLEQVGLSEVTATAPVAGFLSVLIAGLLYVWLANICLLTGAIINAQWFPAQPAQTSSPSPVDGTPGETGDDPPANVT